MPERSTSDLHQKNEKYTRQLLFVDIESETRHPLSQVEAPTARPISERKETKCQLMQITYIPMPPESFRLMKSRSSFSNAELAESFALGGTRQVRKILCGESNLMLANHFMHSAKQVLSADQIEQIFALMRSDGARLEIR